MSYKVKEIFSNIDRLDNNSKVDLKYTVYDAEKLRKQLQRYCFLRSGAEIIVFHELMNVMDRADEHKTKTSIAQKEAMIDRLMNERILLDRKHDPTTGTEFLYKDNLCLIRQSGQPDKVLPGNVFDYFMLPLDQEAVELDFDTWESLKLELKIKNYGIPQLMDMLGDIPLMI